MRVHDLRTARVPRSCRRPPRPASRGDRDDLLDHSRPFFAPIAALIVLGLAPGLRSRRALEMVVGVALGIAVGDLLIAAIGSGAAQIALVGAARDGGGGAARRRAARRLAGGDVGACSSRRYRRGQAVPTRFVDALVGGTVGLAVFAAVPRNPLRTVQRA